MGYRRPHHRRAHIRTNSDGSKSYVHESEVKGHDTERKNQSSSSSGASTGSWLDELLATVAFAGLALFILGLILRWDEALWYLVLFVISLVLILVRNK